MSDWTYELILCEHPQLSAIGTLREGGSKFAIIPPEPNRSWCVVDRNKQHVYYFWQRGSENLAKLIEACETYGFPTEAPSWSRLCKHLWKQAISPTPSKIKPNIYALTLARDKRHWHGCKCVPGIYENIAEIDIKSAYAQSVANGLSLYHGGYGKPIDDGGLIEKWRDLYPTLDKRTRLAMIGWLSTVELRSVSLEDGHNPRLVKKTFSKIYDGGIFNSIHYALWNLFQMLTALNKIAPAMIPRIHTDSLWVDSRIDNNPLIRIFNHIKQQNFEISCKGHGQAFLYDLNTAILGGRLIGIPGKALDKFDADYHVIGQKALQVMPLDERFGHLNYRNDRYSVAQAQAIMKLRDK